MSLQKTRRELAETQSEVYSLRPVRSAGMYTSRTTNGVSHRARNISAQTPSKNSTNNVARWA